MATTSPARIDDDLYASAKLAGEVQSRSASQQVAHWARIGRELEASASVSHRDITAVLAGSASYDGLSAKEQALVRAEWAARMDALREGLDLGEEFVAAGRRSWVELDDRGRVVKRPSPRRKTPAATAAARKTQGAKGAVTAKRAGAVAERGKRAATTRGR